MLFVRPVRCFFIALLLLSAPSQAAKIVVSAFGDSITRGYPFQQSPANGIPNNGGYIPYLQQKLIVDAQWDVTVLNYGYPGERVSTEGFKRFNSTHNYPVLDSEPDYVLIMEGTNDLPLGMVGPSQIANALGYIVGQVKADGRIPILGTLLPRFDTFASSSNITGTNYLIRNLASSNDIILADLYQAASHSYWENIYLGSDKLHPNLAGYALISNTWYSSLLQAKAIQDEIQRERERLLELERLRELQRKVGALSAAFGLLLLE